MQTMTTRSALGICTMNLSSINRDSHMKLSSSNLKLSSRRRWGGVRGVRMEALNTTLEGNAVKPSQNKNIIPNSNQVESLVEEICTTSIAEFELKLNGFRLYIMRDIAGSQQSPPVVAPVSSASNRILTENIPVDGAASTALTVSKPEHSPERSMMKETASSESLVTIKSPVVGFFRRSRLIKGKRAPPSCKEKQKMKENQVVCYVEQISSESPVRTEVAGEIVKILKEDGEPVGYGDPLVTILPSFPGVGVQ